MPLLGWDAHDPEQTVCFENPALSLSRLSFSFAPPLSFLPFHMFSFRRRSSKKAQDASQIRTSPSLPELNSEGIPWPKNLVDVASIRQTPPPDHPQQGAVKTSFQGVDSSSTIPFHKPFRGSPGKPHDGPIFSLYMSNPPSAFDRHKNEHASISGRYSQKRARVPPTFNLMVSFEDSNIPRPRWKLTCVPGCRSQRHGQDIVVTSAVGNCRRITNRDS